jgi:hypothetical protein
MGQDRDMDEREREKLSIHGRHTSSTPIHAQSYSAQKGILLYEQLGPAARFVRLIFHSLQHVFPEAYQVCLDIP